jgi:hypothetical protein
MIYRTTILCLTVACLTACQRQDGHYRKPTSPVTGQIHVDGEPPGSPLQVACHDLNGMDKEHPSVSAAITDNNGTFRVSTYETGDGIPPGEYVLTFSWQEFNLMSMSYGGPDKLNKRYQDPKQSAVRFTVVEGQPLNLGRIELTTESSDESATESTTEPAAN